MTVRKPKQTSKEAKKFSTGKRYARTGQFVSMDLARLPATKVTTERTSSKARSQSRTKRSEHVQLTVLLSEEQDGGWLATCPLLPGCISQGETIAEVKRNIREAIIGWLIVKNQKATAQAKQARRGNRQIQEFALSL